MDSKGGVCFKMSVASAAGTINTAVSLGVSLAALGLAFEFVDRSVERTQRSVSRNGKRKRKRQPLFDFGSEMNMGRKSKSRRRKKIFDRQFFSSFKR